MPLVPSRHRCARNLKLMLHFIIIICTKHLNRACTRPDINRSWNFTSSSTESRFLWMFLSPARRGFETSSVYIESDIEVPCMAVQTITYIFWSNSQPNLRDWPSLNDEFEHPSRLNLWFKLNNVQTLSSSGCRMCIKKTSTDTDIERTKPVIQTWMILKKVAYNVRSPHCRVRKFFMPILQVGLAELGIANLRQPALLQAKKICVFEIQ
jgi:hypothetical protein